MKWIRVLIGAGILVFAGASISVATAGQDPRCVGLSGAAFGLCTAAVNVGCDDEENRKNGCDKIEEKFQRITGEAPPWTIPTCDENNECAVNEFCMKAAGDCDGIGVCTTKPLACIGAAFPVTTCSEGYGGNYCEAYAAGENILCYFGPSFFSDDHDEPVCP